MLDFHHTRGGHDEGVSTSKNNARGIEIEGLSQSKHELRLESNYGDDSQNQSMRFGPESLRDPVVATNET